MQSIRRRCIPIAFSSGDFLHPNGRWWVNDGVRKTILQSTAGSNQRSDPSIRVAAPNRGSESRFRRSTYLGAEGKSWASLRAYSIDRTRSSGFTGRDRAGYMLTCTRGGKPDRRHGWDAQCVDHSHRLPFDFLKIYLQTWLSAA